jgi:hypothetical protein
MSGKSKQPKQSDAKTIESLRHAVSPGRFHRYDEPSQLPAGLSWAGPECQAIVAAASSFSGSTISTLTAGQSPYGDVRLVRSFRADPHSRLWKTDDQVYYCSADGMPWTLHSKDSPDHHRAILTGSALLDLLHDHSLSTTASGTLDEYRFGGAHLIFEDPFR